MGVTVNANGVAVDREPVEVTFACTGEAEFFELSSAFEGRVCELAHGELVVMSPVEKAHDLICAFLMAVLKPFVEETAAGSVHAEPYSMRLGPDLIRQPDLFLVSAGRQELLGDDCLDGPADLVIEVVSDTPAARRRDLHEKRPEYEAHGVREYWAIDQARGAIHVHVLGDDGRFAVREIREGRVESQTCPGLWLDAAWVLGDAPPRVMACLRELLGPNLGAPDA